MKKITVSILSVLMMLSMVFSSSVFAANEQPSAWDSFVGLLSGNATTTATDAAGVEYRGHIQNVGNYPTDGTWIQGPNQLGTIGQSLRLEGFWIQLTNKPANVNIQYRVHVQNVGWMAPVLNGNFAGTEGQAQRIEAIEINLVDDAGNAVQGYKVMYKGHIQKIGDTAWFEDGQELGTTGSSLRLEALEVKIVTEKSDLTAYNAAVAAAAALTEADYTAASWTALQTALTDNVVTDANTQAEVDAATAAINDAIDALVMVTGIDTAVATGKDKITVTFTQAVDTATDTLTVKKASVNVNLDGVVYAEDKMSAVIDTTSNLTKGDYTITLVADGNTSTATVTAADEKVSSIVVTTETAPLNPAVSGSYSANCTIFANYQVLNQYGEKMVGQTLTWTPSTGGAVIDTVPTTTADGKLTIGNYSTTAQFIPGATVYLTGVHAATGTVVNDSVVVGLESKADTTVFKGIYDKTTAKLIDTLPAGFVDSRYILLYEVTDQYGNKIDNPTVTQLTMLSTNPLFIASPSTTTGTDTDVTINGVVYEAVKIVRGTNADKGGTATIQSISNLTGKSVTYDITSEAKAAVKTFTMSSPTTVISEGETAEIPFAAVDQFGTAVTKYSDLNTKVTFSSNLALQQKADGTARLVFTAPSTGAETNADLPVYLTSIVTDGGNFSSLMVNVKETAVPTTIAGVDTTTVPVVQTTIAQGSSQDIYAKDLVVQDQYGRTLTDAQVNTWMNTTANSAIILDSSIVATTPFTIASTSNSSDAARHTISVSTDKFTVTALSGTGLEATENLVFSLSNTATPAPITGSSKSITFALGIQSEYASYEVADIGTMYNDGDASVTTDTKYDKTLKVYGVEADGTKVLLPASQYTTTITGKVTVTSNVISDTTGASTGYAATDFQTSTSDTAYSKVLELPVVIQVYDGTTGAAAAVLNTTLKVSHATPKVASAGFDTTKVVDGAAFVQNGSIATAQLTAVFDATKVVDQYGVAIVSNPTIIISNLTKVTGSTFAVTGSGTTTTTIANATAGDKFTATYTYVGGVTATVNFTVSGTDITAPTITGTALVSNNSADTTLAKVGETATYTLTFSENVTVAVQIAATSANATGTVTDAAVTTAASTKTIGLTVASGDNGAITLATGLYVLTDTAGNTTTYTAAQINTLTTDTVTADTTVPATPTITSVAGDTSSPGVTNDTTPDVVIGNVVAGDLITVLDGSTVVGTGTAVGTTITITTSALTEATHSLTVTATDPAGNVSAASTAFSLVVDVTAPTATLPALTGADNNVTTVVAAFDEPLYIAGVALATGDDVATSFTAAGGTLAITSAMYDSTAQTVTFTLANALDTNTITHNADATKLTDAAGNAYAAKVYTYATAGTLWTTN
ncbi:hypothetical protein [Acetobacterium sp.]|uniref:hypothetical protein n=1 Tax=Acetobacterium sp. TaxID=1872094 RepID=UPI00271A5815|nr:hypothetical protein [Acetobacterium sp.]MDO9493439.1 hypothetical protein [Acetobacterium sp.]